MMASHKDTCCKEDIEEEQQELRFQVRKRISPLPLQHTNIPEYYYSRLSPGNKGKAGGGEPPLDSWLFWEGRTCSPQVEQNCSPSLFLRTPTSAGRRLIGSLKDWTGTEHFSALNETPTHTTDEHAILLEEQPVGELRNTDEITVSGWTNRLNYPRMEDSIPSNCSNDEDSSGSVVWLSKTKNTGAHIDTTPLDEYRINEVVLCNQVDPLYSGSSCNRLEQRETADTQMEEQYSNNFSYQLKDRAAHSDEVSNNTVETHYSWKSPQHFKEIHACSTSSKRKAGKDELDLRAARIMRNREAAQRSRQNAKAKFQYLEKENKRLRGNLYILERENFWLRKQVELVKTCVNQLNDNASNKYDDVTL